MFQDACPLTTNLGLSHLHSGRVRRNEGRRPYHGDVLYEALPVPIENAQEEKALAEPQGSERGRRRDLQIFRVASSEEQFAGY